MRKAAILLLALVLIINSYAQVCIDSGLTTRYVNTEFPLVIRTQNAISENGLLANGFFVDTTNFRSVGFITKINKDKVVEWSKQLSPPTITESIDIYDAKEFFDGSIVALGMHTNLPSDRKKAILYKFSKNGNLMWQKAIDSSSPIFLSNTFMPDAINEGKNGEILFAFHHNISAYGEASYTTIIKLSPSGNIAWQKHFSNTLVTPELMIYNNFLIGNMFVIDDGIYCIGAYPKRAVLVKLDYNTGNYKHGKFSDYDYQSSSTHVASEIFHSTNLVQDKYFSFNTETPFFTPLNEMFTFLFDTSLNIIKQQRITTPGIAYSAMSGVRKNIITTSKDTTLINMPVDAHVYFISIDNKGKVIQERKLFDPNLSFGYYNKNLINGTSDALAVILSANPFNKQSGFELVQYQDYDWGIEGCQGTTEPHVKVENYFKKSDKFTFAVSKALNYEMFPFSSQISDLYFPKLTICKNVSICDSIKIIGVDTICNTRGPVLFKARRRSDCKKKVYWDIDPSAIKQLVNISDSTIAITFKDEWHGYLYATINACRTIKDSFKVDVYNSPEIIDLGKDTSFCTLVPIVLNARKGFKGYVWQDGSTDSTFAVTTDGRYYVTAYGYCNEMFTDTIDVTVFSKPMLELGNDTSICSTPYFFLDAGSDFKSYLWNTGDTLSSIKVTMPDKYYVWVKDKNNCIATDTINILNVYASPKVKLDKKAELCKGQNNFLDAGPGHTSYLWQDGSTQQIIEVNQTGKYKVQVSNNVCTAVDSVIIRQLIPPPSNFLFKDTAICENESIILFSNRTFKDYLWNTNDSTSRISIDNKADYWLAVTDHYGCKGIDSIIVIEKDCPGIFFMPNAFTPNNDTKNDVLQPTINAALYSYSLNIYNRWGQLLFTSTEIENGWDGKLKGVVQETGTYTWVCRYQVKTKSLQQRSGTVVLLK